MGVASCRPDTGPNGHEGEGGFRECATAFAAAGAALALTALAVAIPAWATPEATAGTDTAPERTIQIKEHLS